MVPAIARIFKSLFSMPVWVIVWMCFFLIPANLSGFFFLEFESGMWVATLGAGALFINTIILFMNGGFSKALAIPHLIFWGPLEIILLYRYFAVPDLSAAEQNFILIVAVINGVSLVFDVFDTRDWMQGKRDVEGFPGEPVRF